MSGQISSFWKTSSSSVTSPAATPGQRWTGDRQPSNDARQAGSPTALSSWLSKGQWNSHQKGTGPRGPHPRFVNKAPPKARNPGWRAGMRILTAGPIPSRSAERKGGPALCGLYPCGISEPCTPTASTCVQPGALFSTLLPLSFSISCSPCCHHISNSAPRQRHML